MRQLTHCSKHGAPLILKKDNLCNACDCRRLKLCCVSKLRCHASQSKVFHTVNFGPELAGLNTHAICIALPFRTFLGFCHIQEKGTVARHNHQPVLSVGAQLNTGVLSRFTRVRVIIPHAGAYVPYQAERIATAGRQGLSGGPERMAQLKRLYFDTAMSGETACTCEREASSPLPTGKGAALMVSWCLITSLPSPSVPVYVSLSFPWTYAE